MKYFALLVLCLFLSLISFGQIAIKDYPKQFQCEVDATDQLEFTTATSSCGTVDHCGRGYSSSSYDKFT